MVAERRTMDVDDKPDLIRLVEQVQDADQRHVLRRNGQDVAVVIPLRRGSRHRRGKVMSAADRDAFIAAAGSWSDIDVDQLLDDIYADRDLNVGRDLP